MYSATYDPDKPPTMTTGVLMVPEETMKALRAENERLRAALGAVKDRLLLAWQEGPDTTDSDEACGIYYDYIGEAITAIDAAL